MVIELCYIRIERGAGEERSRLEDGEGRVEVGREGERWRVVGKRTEEREGLGFGRDTGRIGGLEWTICVERGFAGRGLKADWMLLCVIGLWLVGWAVVELRVISYLYAFFRFIYILFVFHYMRALFVSFTHFLDI